MFRPLVKFRLPEFLAIGAIAILGTPTHPIHGAGPTLDLYGGLANAHSPNGATGYFRLEKTASNRWLLADPLGNYFWLRGVYSLNQSDGGPVYAAALQKKYAPGSSAFPSWTFAKQAALRLQTWGFNTIGPYATDYTMPVGTYDRATGNSVQMPFLRMFNMSRRAMRDAYVKNINYGLDLSIYDGYKGAFPDVFDNRFQASAKTTVTQSASTFTQSLDLCPWFIGGLVDDMDDLYGLRRSDATHLGWTVAATSPVQTYNANAKTSYSDTKVYAKSAWQSYLVHKYSTITALNRAWGSNYTTFASNGVAKTGEVIGTADGKRTSFTHTLAKTPVSPRSLAIFAGGAQAADNGNGALMGAVTSASTISYPAGGLTVHFNTPPPAGTLITVSYVAGGWPKHLTHSTGLMDEDGSSPWIGSDYVKLSKTSAGAAADMNAFLSTLASQYFSTVAGALRASLPHHLVFGPAALSGYARPQVLQAAGKYLDVLELGVHPDTLGDPQALTISALNAYEQSGLPIDCYVILTAQADSPFPTYPAPSSLMQDFSTQDARGAAYAMMVNTMAGLQGSDGVSPVIGTDWWEWVDKVGQHANFGLVDYTFDNAYDGVEDQVQAGKDRWGYPVGGQPKNFGNFLGHATAAYLSVQKSLCTELGAAC